MQVRNWRRNERTIGSNARIDRARLGSLGNIAAPHTTEGKNLQGCCDNPCCGTVYLCLKTGLRFSTKAVIPSF